MSVADVKAEFDAEFLQRALKAQISAENNKLEFGQMYGKITTFSEFEYGSYHAGRLHAFEEFLEFLTNYVEIHENDVSVEIPIVEE